MMEPEKNAVAGRGWRRDSANTNHLRNTMMKQEEVFRFQVRELHRLYRVQRTLMVETRSSNKAALHQLDMNLNSGTSNSTLNFADWISLAASEACNTSSEDQSLFSFGKQMKEKIEAQCPQLSWPEAESDLQLTLSIACGTHEKR
ncbi:uncharacterized protein LOC121975761 [Zingiber officinale]|nr:uncharacterized protein LOC121975761 [Zingiber officinale]